MVLVWDYKNGVVVDDETGEVVDQIYVASPVDGFRGEYLDRLHYSVFLRGPVPRGVRRVVEFAVRLLREAGIYVDGGVYNGLVEVASQVVRNSRLDYRHVAATAVTVIYLYGVYMSRPQLTVLASKLWRRYSVKGFRFFSLGVRSGSLQKIDARVSSFIESICSCIRAEHLIAAARIVAAYLDRVVVPSSRAALAVYLAAKIFRHSTSMKEVASCIGRSAVVIRNNLRYARDVVVVRSVSGDEEVFVSPRLCSELRKFVEVDCGWL